MAKFYLFDVNTALQPTVKDTDFMDFYPNVSKEMAWSNLKPYIRQAFNNNIQPFIGNDLYINMKDSDGSNPELVEAIELIKQALALYTIYQAYPHLNQFISDGTVSQQVTDKSQNISQWAFKQARWAQLIAAEKALDVALNYIIAKDLSDYDGSQYTHPWIKDTTTLLKYIRVNGIRAFLNIRPYFDVAVSTLKSIIGCNTFDDLEENMSEEAYAKAIDTVRRYISHKALELAIPRMLTYVEGNAIIFLTSADGITDGYGIYSKPNIEEVSMLLQSCKDDAGRAFEDLKLILNKSPETFTVWAAYLESLKYDTSIVVSRDCQGEVTGGVLLQ